MNRCFLILCVPICFFLAACQTEPLQIDGAAALPIEIEGSLQNPAWSPNGNQIIFTRFRNGYNNGPADIFLYDKKFLTVSSVIENGYENVNLPGSICNAENQSIVFSSSQFDHDEIFVIFPFQPSQEGIQITNRTHTMAYEPSISADGKWIVFESHPLDETTSGVITKYRLDGSTDYLNLTRSDEDCRQPNWSPDGFRIVYQCLINQQWDIWIMNADGTNQYPITSGPGDKTDASFSPDSQWVVYSADHPEIKYSELFVQAISGEKKQQITDFGMYVGAPSWSPDGTKIAFEASPGDPEQFSGTKIWVMNYQLPQ